MKRYCIFLALSLVPFFLIAQISSPGTPASFTPSSKKSNLSDIPVVKLPAPNVKELLIEDEASRKNLKRLKPLRYAKMIPVNFHLNNSGKWEVLPGNGKLWRLAIHSPKAFSLELIFDKYHLPPGATVFVFNEDQSHILGAFTNKNNKENNKLPVAPVIGDKIIIEYFEPANVKFPGVLSISKVGYAYKNIQKHLKSYGSSGSCNIDINCTEGDNWQNEKKAVCRITFNGNLCTGALINNTSLDETPYFLTANHCIDSENDAENTIFYFNYENASCNGTTEPTAQTIAGSSLIATTSTLDFSLVEISSLPPESYMPYYAGWNKNTTAATKGVSIHHPDGDVKKISIENDPLVTGNYGDGYNINSHWWIKTWETGTTEGGSSGAPIFDQNHQIVGDLTGGQATCSNNVNDYYAKFSRSWEDYSSENNQLKHWLDPISSGVDTLQGYDPTIPTDGRDALLLAILNPLDSNYNTFNISPKVIIKNKGSETLTSIDVNYKIDEGSLISSLWTGSLSFNQTDTITFPNIGITSGDHIFKAYSSSPNEGTDTIPQNDTLLLNYFVSYNLDAKLETIYSPKNEYCNIFAINPQVQIKNLGNNNLLSADINYQIDNGSIISKVWTGNLMQLQTATITFDEIDITPGNYAFKTFVSNPNGSLDMKNDNDTLEKSYTINSGEEIRLSLTTDNFGSETSWTLTNNLSQIIYSGNDYDDNVTIEENFCLENDCYNFKISDSANDGICCAFGIGEYTLLYINEGSPSEIIKNNSEFNSEDNTAFCIPILYISFTANTTTIIEEETVQFSNLSIADKSSISYNWTFEGGTPANSTEENPKIAYDISGTYDVSLTITDSFHNLTELKSDFITVTPSENSSDPEILIHPIPSNNGKFTIKSGTLTINKIIIYNTLGKPLLEKSYTNNDLLDLSEFKNGIYILKIYSNLEIHSKKIIIMK